jgi:succinate dehydrogenase / fumarate reductase iron-sulfur subunit
VSEPQEIRLPDKIVMQIERCDGPGQPSRWEEFHVPYVKNANVISVLMEIQRNPVTADGKRTSPPAWDAACLEEVCGSCTMNINGRVRQACSALIDRLEQPVRLQPMKKFPLVRDLTVDRAKMFNSLKRVHAWIPIDGTYDLGPGPRQSPEDQEINYVLSTISQVRLFNNHPTGRMHADERLRGLMESGGVGDCGKAGNCVEACPKGIPLTSSIAEMARATTKQALKDWFARDERKASSGPAG